MWAIITGLFYLILIFAATLILERYFTWSDNRKYRDSFQRLKKKYDKEKK